MPRKPRTRKPKADDDTVNADTGETTQDTGGDNPSDIAPEDIPPAGGELPSDDDMQDDDAADDEQQELAGGVPYRVTLLREYGAGDNTVPVKVMELNGEVVAAADFGDYVVTFHPRPERNGFGVAKQIAAVVHRRISSIDVRFNAEQ